MTPSPDPTEIPIHSATCIHCGHLLAKHPVTFTGKKFGVLTCDGSDQPGAPVFPARSSLEPVEAPKWLASLRYRDDAAGLAQIIALARVIDSCEDAGLVCEAQGMRRDLLWLAQQLDIARGNERTERELHDFWFGIARGAAEILGLPKDGHASELSPALASLVQRDAEKQQDRLDAERYRALKAWHDAPGIPEFDLDEGADALIAARSSLAETPQ